MQVSAFYLPSIASRGEIEKGMAGLRPDLYQQTPVRWLFAWTYNGLTTHDKIMRSVGTLRSEGAAALRGRACVAG